MPPQEQQFVWIVVVPGLTRKAVRETGVAHKRVFTITCSIWLINDIGHYPERATPRVVRPCHAWRTPRIIDYIILATRNKHDNMINNVKNLLNILLWNTHQPEAKSRLSFFHHSKSRVKKSSSYAGGARCFGTGASKINNFIQGDFLTGPPLKMSLDWPPP